MRLDPQVIQQQIANLLLQYPELQEDEILRADSIEAETEAFDFLANIVRRIEDTTALEDGANARIKELSERKTRFERRTEALRALAFKVMQTAEIRKAELPCATLSLRNGTQKVVITDETSLPADCLKTTVVPDRTTIKELLKDGREIPGAFLSNGEETLSIRVK